MYLIKYTIDNGVAFKNHVMVVNCDNKEKAERLAKNFCLDNLSNDESLHDVEVCNVDNKEIIYDSRNNR